MFIIEWVLWDGKGGFVLIEWFLGLFGFNGVFFFVLMDEVIMCGLCGDESFLWFFDVFNNCFIQLFFCVWVDVCLIVQYDCLDDDWFLFYLGLIIGIGILFFCDFDMLDDWFKLYYFGLMLVKFKSVFWLQVLIFGIFGVCV